MTTHLHSFARAAAHALAAIAAGRIATPALAIADAAAYQLHAEQRYAALSVCRGLSRLAAGLVPEGAAEDALRWALAALRWQHLDDLLEAGGSLKVAEIQLDGMYGPGQQMLRELLRVVVAAVESDMRGSEMGVHCAA
jgi:hypothetical protein